MHNNNEDEFKDFRSVQSVKSEEIDIRIKRLTDTSSVNTTKIQEIQVIPLIIKVAGFFF